MRRLLRVLVGNALLIGITIGLALLITAQGEQLHPPGTASPHSVVVAAPHNSLWQLLAAMALIIGTARLLGVAFRYLGQPPVMGEVVGGLVLGPPVLGHLAPGVAATVLPSSVSPSLSAIAQLGVILYMFLVGLEFDPLLLRRQRHVTIVVSHASIVVPFLLGMLLALGLFRSHAGPAVTFASFALFLGVSLSVTAFPVLARILTDQQVHRSAMGNLALACAAVNDATAWCLLALAISVAHANPQSAVQTILLTVGYVAGMLLVARPLIGRGVAALEDRLDQPDGVVAAVVVGVLLSALTTEVIGIHALFGAFLLGVIVPPGSRVARELDARLQVVVRVLLLPAFFAYVGLRTEVGLLSGVSDWLLCGLIILVATAGKFGGTLVGARLMGLNGRDASALAILMNTRGLIELIALNIGLDLGIISPTLFTMLVLMALVTTFATTPIFRWITRRHPWREAESVGGGATNGLTAALQLPGGRG